MLGRAATTFLVCWVSSRPKGESMKMGPCKGAFFCNAPTRDRATTCSAPAETHRYLRTILVEDCEPVALVDPQSRVLRLGRELQEEFGGVGFNASTESIAVLGDCLVKQSIQVGAQAPPLSGSFDVLPTSGRQTNSDLRQVALILGKSALLFSNPLLR